MNRAEKNLDFWRRLVGLEASFPALERVNEKDLKDQTSLNPDVEAEIRASIASHELTQIIVEPGWGATTLFRYILRDARDRAVERLILPISIDLEAKGSADRLTFDRLEHEIKYQIIGLLIDRPWEADLNRDLYFEFIEYDYETDIAAFRAGMRHFLFDERPDAESLEKQFPFLRLPLHNVMNELLDNCRIQTALYFHIPSEAKPQAIRDLVRSQKTLVESGQVAPAAMREVYVCSAQQRNELERDFERKFNVVHCPRYSAAEVFAMLVNRYSPRVPGMQGGNRQGLAVVFAETFVAEAWDGAKSLGDLLDRVRKAMLQRLDCEQNKVPFHLEPLGPDQPAAAKAEPASDAPRKRRRFTRTKGEGESQ